jgi:hypothetical protein
LFVCLPSVNCSDEKIVKNIIKETDVEK